MKRNSFIAATLVAITMVWSCTPAPKGDRAEIADVFEIPKVEESEQYQAVLEESVVEWLGTKPGGSHNGTVMLSSGTVFVKDGSVVGGKFEIDLNTIRALDLAGSEMEERLVGHLKSPDFFAVDSFPTATFEIAEVVPFKPEGQQEEVVITHQVKGNLTVRGITKGITFNANIVTDENTLTVKTNQFVINRTWWNVNYGSRTIFADLKDNFIHDDIGLTITFKAVK